MKDNSGKKRAGMGVGLSLWKRKKLLKDIRGRELDQVKGKLSLWKRKKQERDKWRWKSDIDRNYIEGNLNVNVHQI